MYKLQVPPNLGQPLGKSRDGRGRLGPVWNLSFKKCWKTFIFT